MHSVFYWKISHSQTLKNIKISEIFTCGRVKVHFIRASAFSSVQLFSCTWLFATPWTAAGQASLSLTISQSLPKFILIASVMPSSHLILCHFLLLPSIFPSIRDFSNESSVHLRRPKYWSFSVSISPSGEYSGLISLKIDWFDFLAIQGTSGSLLKHHS